MSAPPQAKGEPITSKAQLIAYFEAGCKPQDLWRIGTEHEKFAYTVSDLRSLPYDGERSIRALLQGLVDRYGWEAIRENGHTVALSHDGCNVSLEPGGKVELSGAPVETIHQ